LYIFPFMYMYIFGSRVLISIQLLFITWYTKLVFRVRDVLSLPCDLVCSCRPPPSLHCSRSSIVASGCYRSISRHRFSLRSLPPCFEFFTPPVLAYTAAAGSPSGHRLRASNPPRRWSRPLPPSSFLCSGLIEITHRLDFDLSRLQPDQLGSTFF
jgi:hypothetical protein